MLVTLRLFSFKTFLVLIGCTIAVVQVCAQVPMIRLSMSGSNGSLDETVLYYQEGASSGFDSQYDAYKLTGPNPAPLIAQKYGNVLMQINGVAPVSQTFNIQIKTTTPVTSTFTLTASDFQFLPKGTCVKLNDVFTGQLTDITFSSYSFTLADTTTVPRFLLEITYNSLPVIKQPTPPSCNDNNGEIIIQGNSGGPWDFLWKDSTGAVIRSSLNKYAPDTLSLVPAGKYFVDVYTVGGCDHGHDSIILVQAVKPTALFFCQDSVSLTTGGQVSIQNQSTAAVNSFWDFGDGIGTSTLQSPQYTYTDTGHFVITLIAESAGGCYDTLTKEIAVYADVTTGMNSIDNKTGLRFWNAGNRQYYLQAIGEDLRSLTAEVYDISGRKIKSIEGIAEGTTVLLSFEGIESGVYLLRCSSKEINLKTITFILN